jgi:hypothetical protein
MFLRTYTNDAKRILDWSVHSAPRGVRIKLSQRIDGDPIASIFLTPVEAEAFVNHISDVLYHLDPEPSEAA